MSKYPAPTPEQARILYRTAAQQQFGAWVAGWRELSKAYRTSGDHSRADDALEMAHWFEYALEIAAGDEA